MIAYPGALTIPGRGTDWVNSIDTVDQAAGGIYPRRRRLGEAPGDSVPFNPIRLKQTERLLMHAVGYIGDIYSLPAGRFTGAFSALTGPRPELSPGVWINRNPSSALAQTIERPL